MSSVYVRTKVKDFLAANAASEKVIDLSAVFDDIRDMISDAGLDPNDPWLGLQFLGNGEDPITVPANNIQGKYRELGAIYLHVVDIAKLGVADSILMRAESLRNLFRGQRIDDVTIESVTPANFGNGATLDFEGGYTSASIIVNYKRDFDL